MGTIYSSELYSLGKKMRFNKFNDYSYYNKNNMYKLILGTPILKHNLTVPLIILDCNIIIIQYMHTYGIDFGSPMPHIQKLSLFPFTHPFHKVAYFPSSIKQWLVCMMYRSQIFLVLYKLVITTLTLQLL